MGLLIEGIAFLTVMYVMTGISMYLYCIVLNKQYVGQYIWRMDEKHVGICKYPKWAMFWIYKLYTALGLHKQ